jgi:hypothetical protein
LLARTNAQPRLGEQVLDHSAAVIAVATASYAAAADEFAIAGSAYQQDRTRALAQRLAARVQPP